MATALKYEIRRANQFDLPALEILLAKGIEESKGLLPPYDWPHVYHAAINQIQAGLIFVAGAVDEEAKREKVVGVLVLDAQHFSWSPKAGVIRSVHFYVLPEERGKTLSDGKTLIYEGLIQAGEWLANAAGVPLLIEILHQMGPEARIEAKDKLMEKAGLTYVGGSWLYMPKVAAEEKAA